MIENITSKGTHNNKHYITNKHYSQEKKIIDKIANKITKKKIER